MYTGNNKIALQSQEMIAHTFMEQLKYKSFQKISISELCNKAMVSRQTFYTLFDSKENILYYEYKKRYLDISNYFVDEDIITVSKLVHVFITHISKYSDFFTMLVDNNLTEILNNGIKESLSNCEKLSLCKENFKDHYAIAFISGALSEVIKNYIKSGKNDDLDIVEELLVTLFEGRYLSTK